MHRLRIILLLSASLGILQTPARSAQPKPLERRIAELGSQTEMEDLHQLARYKPKVIQLLVRELKPIELAEVPDQDPEFEKELHIIWCVRALEKLTRQTFKAPTTYIFDIEASLDEFHRARYVCPDHGKCRFWGFWETHLTYYIAPLDAQQAIIQQWKEYAIKAKSRGGLTLSSTRTPPALPSALSLLLASSAPLSASVQSGPG